MTLGDFSQQAESYRQSRPTYPTELIDLLIADAGLAAGDAVADFGAGTGIMTEILLERGFMVTAIEPNESMCEQAGAKSATWVDGTFEASRLGNASQNWAVAAQAFHWADPPRSLPEIRRVLKPGSLFTVLWNNRATQQSEILRWTEDAIRRHVPDFDEAYRNRPWAKILASTGDFTFLNQRTVLHTIEMTIERYLNLWKSHNRLNTIAGPERFAAYYQDLSRYLEKRADKTVAVPYHCEAWSVRRND